MQTLWAKEYTWDEQIPTGLSYQWNSICKELTAARNTVIPRQYFPLATHMNADLHIFCDASANAYGAVAYLQYEQFVSLAMSKTRVKPLKDITIPRLELLATLIGARMCKYICQAFQSSPLTVASTTLWTDSQIVLHWINCNKHLPLFVANRTTEIRGVQFNAHKYCPTSDNPADLLTRGITANQLHESTLWWHGPPWLAKTFCESLPQFVSSSCASDTCVHLLQSPRANEVVSLQASVEHQRVPCPTGLRLLIDVARFSNLD